MLKTYQLKTHCKGDSRSSKTANIILPGLMIKQSERPFMCKRNGIQIQLYYLCWLKHEFEYYILLANVRAFTFVLS